MRRLARWFGVFGCIAAIGACGGRSSRPAESDRDKAVRILAGGPDWLVFADICPADVMPASFIEPTLDFGMCASDDLLACVDRCGKGAGGMCYLAAIDIQATGEDARLVEALFLRSCRLGIASGCTNRVAGRAVHANAPLDACAFRTLERVCEEAGDPWGCTMFALALIHRDGDEVDRDRVREVLRKGCAYGEDDPACEAARGIEDKLDATVSPDPPEPKTYDL